MAVNARDIPLTREEVYGWIQGYKKAKNLPSFDQSLRDYLTAKIEAKKLDDVNTSAHESLRDTTSVVDMVLMDLPSYGVDDG